MADKEPMELPTTITSLPMCSAKAAICAPHTFIESAAEAAPKDAAPEEQANPAEFYGLTAKDIDTAFALLNGPRGENLRRRDIRDFASTFFPDITPKQLKQLVGSDFTRYKLQQLLSHEDSAKTGALPPPDFDPVAEAFALLDVDGTGEISPARLVEVFQTIPSVDALSNEDVQLLMQMADVDGDGKLTLTDFRTMLNQKVDMAAFLKDEKEKNTKDKAT